MARFIGTMANGKSSVNKIGYSYGLEAHIRGWNIGVRVVISIGEDGKDIIHVYQTKGSNGDISAKEPLLLVIR